MKPVFCTITTYDYLHKVRALYSSLKKQNPEVELKVLIVDPPEDASRPKKTDYVHYYYPDALVDRTYAKEIIEKYYPKEMDALRWSLKSVFLHYLLEEEKQEGILYVDNDIAFFDSYAFLFEKLKSNRVLLTPHWRNMDPEKYEDGFVNNFLDGLYNGGFFAAAQGAGDVLDWWAKVNLFHCVKDKPGGFFVDQRYLDLIPVRFTGVEVLRHQGCNVAFWNQIDCKRGWKDGKIVINGEWPVVFLHLTNDLIRDIKDGKDPLLLPFLEEYERWLGETTTL